MKLNRGAQKRYERFAQEYSIDGNATRAALAAGYSRESAHVRGCELVKNRKVARLIDKFASERAAKREITAELVLDGLRALATFDPRRLYDDDGNPKNLHELDEETAKAVVGFDLHELTIDGDGEGPVGTVKKYKLADRQKALEALGRTMAMFTDKVKHEGLEGLADAIARGRKRLADNG